MKEFVGRLGVAIIILIGVQSFLNAQVPRLLNYQGVLTEADGLAVADGTYSITFRLYDGETGGTMLWEETNSVVTLDGVFERTLGLTTPMNLGFDAPYWLSLSLQGGAEMTPRIRMVSSPYAMNAATAQSANGIDPNAPDIVHTLNGLDGRLRIVGAGGVTVTEGGEEITIAVADRLPANPSDGQIIRYNGATGAWEATALRVETAPRIGGDGSSTAPLDIAQMGAADGEPLVWDQAVGAWAPGESRVSATAPILGTGVASDPIRLANGSIEGQVILWNGTAWTTSATVDPDEGDLLIWNETTKNWTPGERGVASSAEIAGDGTVGDPLRLARQGASDGEVLRWDPTAAAFVPGNAITTLTPPLDGTGSATDPLRFQNGSEPGEVLYWNGAGWRRSASVDAGEGWVLRWNDVSSIWEPGIVSISDMVPLSGGAIWYGNGSNVATELPIGSPGQVLVVNTTASGPEWSGYLQVDSVDAIRVRTTGDIVVGGDLGVSGDVQLANGVIDNVELANSGLNVRYGSGLEGEATVELGDTLDLRNSGVLTLAGGAGIAVDTSAGNVTVRNEGVRMLTGGPGVTVDTSAGNVTVSSSGVRTLSGGAGIAVDTSAGDVTVINTGVLTLAGGAGIAVDTSAGDVTVRNEGVRTLTGTPNQILVDTTLGDVTLSTPQNIDSSATPYFAGLTLSGLIDTSISDTLLVSNAGTIESRTVASLVSSFDGLFWTINGNAGTSPDSNFVGTLDDQAFEVHVANDSTTGIDGRGRVMRFEPDPASPRIIGGYQGNTIGTGGVGGTIGGGGLLGDSNVIHDTYSTIGGGRGNEIAASLTGGAISGQATIGGGTNNTILSWQSTIAGGAVNRIDTNSRDGSIGGGGINHILAESPFGVISGGYRNLIGDSVVAGVIGGGFQDTLYADADYSVIGGGLNNVVEVNSPYGVIAGGRSNRIDSNSVYAFIGGGFSNIADRSVSTVGGGTRNHANGAGSFIGGGYENLAFNNDATIAGGARDTTYGLRSFMGAGEANKIDSGSSWAVLVGGYQNRIGSNSALSIIGGGYRDSIGNLSPYSSVVGGRENVIADSSAYSLISSGLRNRVDSNADYSSVHGGRDNRVAHSYSFVGSGSGNLVSADHASVVGGTNNHVAGGGGFIGGGINNFASHFDAIIAGGAGDTSYGYRSFIGSGQNNFIDSSSYSGILVGRNNRIAYGSSVSAIGGGDNNRIDSGADWAFIGGGLDNVLLGHRGVIGGGQNNRVSTGNGSIVGGVTNHVNGGGGFIGGGLGNYSANLDASVVAAYFDTVYALRSIAASGQYNFIDSTAYVGILGGSGNRITRLSTYAFIGTGEGNTIDSSYAGIITGGQNNMVDNSAFGAILGGADNTLTSNALYSTILGGSSLTLTGINAVGYLGRGPGNIASPMTVSQANVAVLGNVDLWLANNTNAPSQIRFYEAYNATGAFPNTANYTSFEAQPMAANIEYILPAAAGAVGQQMTISGVVGAQVTLGWAAASDKGIKTDFLRLSGEDVLTKFKTLELGSWRYDPSIDPNGKRHYGVMAQDFHAAFGEDELGEIGADTTVDNIDLHGVSFLAIQGLEERTTAQQEEIDRLRRENEELRERLQEIEELLRGE